MNDRDKIIAKYELRLEKGMWWQEKENSHKLPIFRDSFVQKNDILGLLFRVNKLCAAKVKYFRTNLSKFEPLKYDYKQGFIPVDLWDSDFLRHKASGYIFDYRYLQTITIHEEFLALCKELESLERV